MPLASLPVALVEHILSFTTTGCTRKSRASLVQEVLTTCVIFDDLDEKKQCVNNVLRRHTEECRQCTIKFSNFRYKVSEKKMYFKFNMRIGFPTGNYDWYTQKLREFCKQLNEDILYKVADNDDKDAFSPEEYDSTGDRGEDLGHGRAPAETYHNPVQSENNIVLFSCLMYLTRFKANYDDLLDEKKNQLKARAARTQEKIKQQFTEQDIMRNVGEYLKKEMCKQVFVDCSYTVDGNTLRIRGFVK